MTLYEEVYWVYMGQSDPMYFLGYVRNGTKLLRWECTGIPCKQARLYDAETGALATKQPDATNPLTRD
eukprot:gene8281-4547_t